MEAPADVHLIDSHAHLDHDEFDDDRAECLARARDAGVLRVINIGSDVPSSELVVELAADLPGCYATVGIHPHDATTANEVAVARIGELLRADRVVAIGEVGLDFHYDLSPRDTQRQAFRRQLALARERDVPLVIHSREADTETMEILRSDGLPGAGGVMHCFPGDVAMAAECEALGLHIGITGIVTFKNAEDLRAVAAQTGLDRLLVETDCPYLAPAPRRGKRNEPAFVRYVAEFVAELRGLPLAEVAAATTRNAQRLFALGP